jgi:hypothetical protein
MKCDDQSVHSCGLIYAVKTEGECPCGRSTRSICSGYQSTGVDDLLLQSSCSGSPETGSVSCCCSLSELRTSASRWRSRHCRERSRCDTRSGSSWPSCSSCRRGARGSRLRSLRIHKVEIISKCNNSYYSSKFETTRCLQRSQSAGSRKLRTADSLR